jgi:serine phosphatase RsbU (regulator of sigma subunit)
VNHLPSPAWDDAPCGLLTLGEDGTITSANRTLLEWVGHVDDAVVGRLRLSELLSAGGRIYWETHLSPLLYVDGRIDEVALELRSPAGRMPVLLTAVTGKASDGSVAVHVALSSARDRSRYERELLAARHSADRSAAQLAVLQEVTSSLSAAPGVDAVHRALETAAARLGSLRAELWTAEDDGGELTWSAAAGAEAPRLDVDAIGNPRILADGRAVLPLRGRSRLHGVLVITPRTDADADPLDLEVLTAVALQAGIALDRSRLFEQHASVARELQHSLLAGDPPDDDRFTVATVYRPGVELLEVGGDWHDVFLAGDGILSVAVGDVVGRGLTAASAMGKLRSAVRAVAGPDVGPASVLSRLDRFVEQVPAAALATIAYTELDLARGLVRYACAGHLPPLLLRANGDDEVLWGGRSTPLGAFVQAEDRGEAEVQLAPGDLLLLYTDGLIERRDRGLDDGIEALAVAAAAVRDLPLPAAVRTLTMDMLRDEIVRDDVCVLLLKWTGHS